MVVFEMEKAVDEDKEVPSVTTAPPILSSFPLGYFGKLFWRRAGEGREHMPCNFESQRCAHRGHLDGAVYLIYSRLWGSVRVHDVAVADVCVVLVTGGEVKVKIWVLRRVKQVEPHGAIGIR